MAFIGKHIRLSRFFADGANAVIVALDHGAAFGPLAGLTDIAKVSRDLKAADGILLNPGMVEPCREVFVGPRAPRMIIRLTWLSSYCVPWDYTESQTAGILSPAEALDRGAEMVTACCMFRSGREATDRDNVKLFSTVAEEKERAGIPLMGEFEPFTENLSPEQIHQVVAMGARIMAELGADLIKTYYTGERFSEIVEAVPVPILVLGGDKMNTEREALVVAQKSIQAGARGVVFGRNVFQAHRPAVFLEALKDVVHNRVSADEATKKYSLDGKAVRV